MESENLRKGIAIHWFRHGLRLHDMPSLNEVLKVCSVLYPVFIFDGETAGTKVLGYNRLRFLLEALQDVDSQFKKYGGSLYIYYGDPVNVFEQLFKKWKVTHLSFEQDPEPVWQNRDFRVGELCKNVGIQVIERVSHTLWNPKDVINMNGGTPPLTYSLFCHVTDAIGSPPRPMDYPDFTGIEFPLDGYNDNNKIPTPETFGVQMECPEQANKIWTGGEARAIQHLEERLEIEEVAFRSGYYMPNQLNPDLLGPPMSMSAALRFGCLSVRRFYWSLYDLYKKICPDMAVPHGLTGQLIWREYFYTMSVNNIYYDTMIENPICLNISWKNDEKILNLWAEGKTGYPFIDAAMRQLKQEGWIHHVARNAVACFLTRGDLWITWEDGLKIFLKYLLDADWSVCAGNWMWVSSSAFENILQCSSCISPISYGRRLDPTGEYIRRYIPELKKMPLRYLFEPWIAPVCVQEESGCFIGKDYPQPIVDHQIACLENGKYMEMIKDSLTGKPVPPHCSPSNPAETRVFLWLPEKCADNIHPCFV